MERLAKINWAIHGPTALSLYETGQSPKDIAGVLPYKRTTIKEFLRRLGKLRTQSAAAKLAADQGKKNKAIAALATANRTTNRNNPAKFPWKGHPELNPRFLKDRSKVKCQRSRAEARAWVKAVFVRDDYTCKGCKQRGERLQAHHIKSYSRHPECRETLANGVTLCVACHKKTDNYGAKAWRA